MPRPRQSDSPLTQPLSGKRFKRELKAAGRLAVGPEKRIVKAEKRASKVQMRHIRDWFPEYDKAIKEASQRTTSAYSQADQRMANASSTAAEYANKLRQELAGEAQTDAMNRGVTYDPSGSETNAAAQLARINSTDTLRGVTASQGAAQGAYFDDKRRIGEREKIEQLLTEQARKRSYGQDLKDLARRQSDAMLQERGRLRDSERDYYLGLLAARGEKKAQAFTEKNARADRRFDRNQAQADRRFDRNESAKDRKASGSSSSGGGADKNRDAADVSKAVQWLKAADRGDALEGKSKEQIRAILQSSDDSFSPNEINAAIRRWKKWDKKDYSDWGTAKGGKGKK